MARRKRESGLESVLNAPWRVNAVAAVGALLVLSLVIPAILTSHPVLRVLGTLSQLFGYLATAGLGLVALLGYLRETTTAPEQRSEPAIRPRAPAPEVAIDVAWGQVGAASTNAKAPAPKPTEWSLALLRRIEWKRFEELTAAYFREKSFRTETIAAGADGGVDVKLFVKGKDVPFAIVQCKAWNTQRVGVNLVRELLGVMVHQKVPKGIFATTADYTGDAVAFAKENPINLITGEMFLKGILALQEDSKQRLLAVASEGDYTTPTCPSCGVKMVARPGKAGEFWGCPNFPRCRQTFKMRFESAAA